MSALDELFILLSALMLLCLQAGFLTLEAGMVRAKNAANVALKNLSDVCIVTLGFWATGFGLMFGPSLGGWVGTGPFFMPIDSGQERGLATLFLFEAAFAATAATIVSGAVAEREKFSGYILLSLALGAVVYPVAGHWVWAGSIGDVSPGWLAAMGFLDFAGATVVHSVGGWAAIAFAVILGPRLGRFGSRERRFPENSFALAGLGGVLFLLGWGAFNGGSALRFDGDIGAIVARTFLTAASGGAVALLYSAIRGNVVRPDLLINGMLAGLVAGTAGINLYDASTSIAVGAIGAMAMVLGAHLLDHLRIDDVVRAAPTHLFAGVWGTLAVALLAPIDALPAGSRLGQLEIQAIGAGAMAVWVLGTMGPLALVLRGMGLLRAHPREEVKGLNSSQLGYESPFMSLPAGNRKAAIAAVSSRVGADVYTEAGALAHRYSKIVSSIEEDLDDRNQLLRQESELRKLAEAALNATRKAQQESAWAARHDSLTQLGNRMLLEEMLGVDARDPSEQPFAIAIDMDRFKAINDSYGHEAGDAVLQATAKRLKKFLRSRSDFAFRIGGDEFVVLLNAAEMHQSPQAFCDWLIDDLLEPVPYDDIELRVGASVGFAHGAPGEPFRETLRRADMALYEAKRQGRSLAIAYTATIGALHSEKTQLAKEFADAMERGEISAVFQPQVEAETMRLAGMEVLARWTHPERGTLPPSVFMPLAEELRAEAALDRRMLDLAIEGMAYLHSAGIEVPMVSVNVSARRLNSPDLLDELKGRHDLPRGQLAFEVLETAFLDSVDDNLEARIKALKGMGIRLEVDDFGTGHASLASVLALKPERLKIDRMFVQGIDADERRQELMLSLLQLAGKIGAQTIVEGVETQAEADVLTRMGVPIFQGFAVGRPMPLGDFEVWARERENERNAGQPGAGRNARQQQG